MKYRKDLDGLRAIAVLAVILYHAGFNVFSGGYVGVDIFFVISGYLITAIIINDIDNDSFSIGDFYERRARRILPVLFFVMLLTIPFAWMWMLPSSFGDYSNSLIAVPLFSSNILFYLTSGYFGALAELKPLLHTWSLAVEEQYYILFPIFILAVSRFNKKWIPPLLVLAMILSLLAAQYGSAFHPNFTFFMLPTRAFEILIGALLSFYAKFIRVDRRVAELASFLGLTLVLLPIFYFDSSTPSPSFYTLIPTIGVGMIILFSELNTFTARILGNKLLVGIGLISYSAYLWHQPLFAFYKIRTLDGVNPFISSSLVFLSIFFAYFTWKFIEIPFRNKALIRKKLFILFGVIFTLFFIFIGVMGHLLEGVPSRINNSEVIDISINSIYTNIPRIDNGWCFYSIDSIRNLEIGEKGTSCFLGDTNKPKRKAILFGDSFAGSYEPFWDSIGILNNIQIQSVATNWCYPSFKESFTGPTMSNAFKQCAFNRDYLKNRFADFDFVILYFLQIIFFR